MSISPLIRRIPDHPRPGIVFYDLMPLLQDASGFRLSLHKLVSRYSSRKIQKVVAIEARGFIVGAPLAYALGVGFVPVRKRGKLPAATLGLDYETEYGSDRMEIHADALQPGERALLVDDVLATGGTMSAAAELVRRLGGDPVECAFVLELLRLGGRQRLEAQGLNVYSLTETA